ncbi:hypothetical protein JL107_14400 [Nakamurella flavida]|uniref:Uncharacterized protein n=1 Tax=Nakamurella flavida TaxID=363630 RepID=A0A938YLZ6_9ACTN|nr:hypothetical protein [Nakamurella flavida]MBM9477639.1 hypothetical protein [Nakamurella flavida]MDP9779189.1 hypothetical protein [Nakamurella flavida]
MNEPVHPGARGAAAGSDFRDPGPVPATGRANFRGLPNLVGRDRDTARFIGVGLLLIAVGFPLLIFLVTPARSAHAFGYARPTVVTVEQVTEKPHRKRHHDPSWRVEVSWTQDGVERTGEGVLRGPVQPTQVGDRLDAQVSGTGGGEGSVSFASAADDRALVFGVLAASVASAVGGVILFRSSGERKKLLRVVGRSAPRRAVVRAVERNPFVWEDSGPTRVVSLVEFGPTPGPGGPDRPAGPGGAGHVVLRSGEVDLLDPGDVIDIWRNAGRGEQQVAVRRASDGTWWVGRGKAPTT